MKLCAIPTMVGCFCVLISQSHAQDLLTYATTDQSETREKKYSKEIIHPKKGITLFDGLNPTLSGDSVRLIDGYAAKGWIQDYYKNGQLLHHGFYMDGQLKHYKNYYPNGELERDFITIDNDNALLKQYFSSGKLKCLTKLIKSHPVEIAEYHKNGNLKYEEVFHKDLAYHEKIISYFPNGKPKSDMLLSDKKSLLYSRKDYHPNGKLKSSGQLQFDNVMFDYIPISQWNFFDEAGELTKSVNYQLGGLMTTDETDE